MTRGGGHKEPAQSAESTTAQSPVVPAPFVDGFDKNQVLTELRQLSKDVSALTAIAQRLVDDVKDQSVKIAASEVCVAKIETKVDHAEHAVREVKGDLKSLRDTTQLDFRILFGAIITVALGLAAIMAHGFKWL